MEKYYNGVVGQMLEGLGSVENNSFLVCHRGEVSMEHLEAAERAKERTDIYFAVYEFFRRGDSRGLRAVYFDYL